MGKADPAVAHFDLYRGAGITGGDLDPAFVRGVIERVVQNVAESLNEQRRVALEGRSIAVDTASVNDRVFLNTSSVGAYVTFVRARERLEKHLGYHIASFVAAIRLLLRLPTFRVTLQVEGVARELVQVVLWLVLNASRS